MCHSGPDFLTVYNEVIPVDHSTSAQIGQIRPGTGFGISLTPDVFAAKNTRQPVILLRLRSELDNQRTDHLNTHITATVNAITLLFLIEDQQFRGLKPHATKFGGPCGCYPAFGMQFHMPMRDFREFGAVRQVAQFFGVFRFEKTTNLGAEIRIRHCVPICHLPASSVSRASNQRRR